MSKTEHPLTGVSLKNWLKLLQHHALKTPHPTNWSKLIEITKKSVTSLPHRLKQKKLYTKIINRSVINPSPIFIIGYWRSGTTHLHNLLCQNKFYGYITTRQALFPDFFLIPQAFSDNTSQKRQIDNLVIDHDSPQEEEFIIASKSIHSVLHQHYWPNPEKPFELPHLSHSQQKEWSHIYLEIMKAATYKMQSKTLILKNPANLIKVPELLKLFPQAKFIHIHRCPYELFESNKRTTQIFAEQFSLKKAPPTYYEPLILNSYSKMMQKFLDDSQSIPKSNFITVRYTDLCKSPRQTIDKIYEKLQLQKLEDHEKALDTYLDKQQTKKSTKNISKETIQKVNTHWHFALKALGYDTLS